MEFFEAFLNKTFLNFELYVLLLCFPKIIFSIRFDSTTRPCDCLSSGIKLIPVSLLSLVDNFVISISSKNICPDSTGYRPKIASLNSLWPLPSTPAIPHISPFLISKLISSKGIFPKLGSPLKSLSCRQFSLEIKVSLLGGVGKSFPIIISASIFFEAFSLLTVPTC